MIFTIDSDGGASGDSDDDAFAMGGAAVRFGGAAAAPAPPPSRKRNATTTPSLATSLDEKLQRRAAKLAVPPAPAGAAGASDETAEVSERPAVEGVERHRASKKAAQKPKKLAEPAAAAASTADAAADDDAQSFEELKLAKPLLKATRELGWERPTPIQARVIPFVLSGADVCASALTGSGKTAAFMLPVLERLLQLRRGFRTGATRVVVLTPTRELAAQVESMSAQLCQFCEVRLCLVVGGLSAKLQEAELRERPDVVVATPGRLIDLMRNSPSVGLEEVEVLVLDEADRMLDIGFRDEVEEIVRACPTKRQTLLFSATISEEVAALANVSLNKPVQLRVDPLFNVNTQLTQEFVRLKAHKEHEREATLLSLAARTFTSRAIIFVASKATAHRLKILFGLAGLRAAELHGNLTQQQRLDALDTFAAADADFLIATDLAGRGLDIKGVTTVINYELPTEMKTYVHRVGRTARAGADGRAVSLVAERDRPFLKLVLKHATSAVKTRAVPQESVGYWAGRIAGMEGEVASVLAEERDEKALRVAEMEANKASNLIDHREEIMARPARSWFQSEKERQATKERARATAPTAIDSTEAAAAAAAAAAKEAKRAAKEAEKPPKKIKRDKYAGMTRKKRRALQRKELFETEEAEGGGGSGEDGEGGDGEGGGGGGKKRREAVPDAFSRGQKAMAKSAKAAARGGFGAPQVLGKRARALAAAAAPTDGNKRPKKRYEKKEDTEGVGKPAHEPRAARAEQRRPPKKVRSHSKAKFSKPRKR